MQLPNNYEAVSVVPGTPDIESLITPRVHARARGYVIGRGLYIRIYYLQKNFRIF